MEWAIREWNILVACLLLILPVTLLCLLAYVLYWVKSLSGAYRDFASVDTHGSVITLMAIFLQIFVMVGAIFGLLAARKSYKWAAYTYLGICVVCVYWYESTAIAAQQINQTMQTDTCTSTMQYFNLSDFTNRSKLLLCSSDCYCYFPTFWDLTPKQQSLSGRSSWVTYNHSDATKISQCPNLEWIFFQHKLNTGEIVSRVSLMEYLEMELQCSGWCDGNSNGLYYMFTGINKGRPKYGACYSRWMSVIKTVTMVFSIIGFVMMAVCLVAFGLSISLIRQFNKEDQQPKASQASMNGPSQVQLRQREDP